MQNIKKIRQIDSFYFTSFLAWTFLIFWTTVTRSIPARFNPELHALRNFNFTEKIFSVKLSQYLAWTDSIFLRHVFLTYHWILDPKPSKVELGKVDRHDLLSHFHFRKDHRYRYSNHYRGKAKYLFGVILDLVLAVFKFWLHEILVVTK